MIYKMRLLILVFVVALVTLASADSKVNLIHPTIIGAQPISTSIGYNNYSFIIYTSAAKYKVVNFDLINGTRGHIERMGDWNQPDLVNQALFEYESKASRTARLNRIQSDLESFPKGAKYLVEAAAAMHNCEVLLKIGQYDLCTRKSHLLMKSRNSSYIVSNLYLDHSTYAAPVTAAFVLQRSTGSDGFLVFDVIAFDSTGRASIIYFDRTPDNKIQTKILGAVDLSSILNPLASLDLGNVKPWAQQSYLMIDKPELRDILLANAETKMMGCYIESITPMYQRVEPMLQVLVYNSSLTVIDRPAQNNSTKTVQFESKDTSSNQIAFCLSRGLRMFEDPKTRSNIQCSLNGESQNNYIDSIGISNTYSRFTPLAFQLTSTDNFRYIHLVYSLIDYPTTNYMFCKRSSPLEPGKELSDKPIMVDWPQDQLVEGCVRTLINNPPDDIVLLQQNKCSLHAAFYGPVYTLSPVDSSLLEQMEKPQLLRDITFHVNAAFAMKESIYFFSGANRMIVVNYQINDDCKSISLEMDTLKEMSSEQYIYENFLKYYDGQLGEPSFIDYREFAEGAENTNPPLSIGSAPPPALPPPGPVPVAPKSSGSNSKLIIIAVGIIIGGLIIASVIYFLCLRGRDEEPAPKAQSRKSRRSPSGSPMSELVSKTVRSKFQSSTGGTPVVAAKSHKSRAMSPIKSAKSTRKSALHFKSSKKSKLNIKSIKTTTRSPLSV